MQDADIKFCVVCFVFSRLLFTEESILQHELGRGQLAFKWHKRSKPTAAAPSAAAMSTGTDKTHADQSSSPKKNEEDVKDGSMDSAEPQASSGKIKGGGREGETLHVIRVTMSLHSRQKQSRIRQTREGRGHF